MINFPMSTVSLSLLKENQMPTVSTNSNMEQLQILKDMVEAQKNKGHKYPLLASIFLVFYYAGKNILTKTELYDLMDKLTTEDKNKIISAPNERYSIITPNNFKSKIKDIIKKKRWFTRRMNDAGEIEYELNAGTVSLVLPKIEAYLKMIEKRDSIFQNDSRGIIDEDNLNVEIPETSELLNEQNNMQINSTRNRLNNNINNNANNNNYMNNIK